VTESEKATVRAWQPLTPRGVAAFACAPAGRLLLVQFVFAVFAAAVVVWFLHAAWFPTIREAIEHLPGRGEIRSGTLNWPGDAPQSLAEGDFLAFAVDLDHRGGIRSPAHIQIELGRHDCRMISFLGYADFVYPKEWIVSCNRAELGPWWGAWQAPILWIAAGAVIPGLLLSWWVLAALYSLPVWLVGFFMNRDLSLSGSWRLAGAALMPGALVLSCAVLLYGFGFLDLVQLSFAATAHVVLGWIYIFVGPLFAPKLSSAEAVKRNPFRST
jgi:hypothetical protein